MVYARSRYEPIVTSDDDPFDTFDARVCRANGTLGYHNDIVFQVGFRTCWVMALTLPGFSYEEST